MSGFYNTKKWKSKREKILKRDSYKCRECARIGRMVQANPVHHLAPIEEFPEYRLCDFNLISLCNEHHNKCHNRADNSLTEYGIDLALRELRKFQYLPQVFNILQYFSMPPLNSASKMGQRTTGGRGISNSAHISAKIPQGGEGHDSKSVEGKDN